MDGNILVFIKDYQLNRVVLNAINQLKISFFECFREEDIYFKIQLFEENNKLFVYEFLHEHEEEQFKLLKKMSEKGFKILVIFPEYSIPYIDQGQEVGVDDMLVHPIEMNTLKNKISSLLSLPIEEDETQVIEDVVTDYLEVVAGEVGRARRGRYDLSFVMFSFTSVAEEKLELYFRTLKSKLRETDIILNSTEKNKYILVCPFTKKDYLVEVENKVREAFKDMKKHGTFLLHAKIFIHGLTLGTDGDSFEELFERMTRGIEESKQFENRSTKALTYKKHKNKIKAYGRMYKWN